MKKKGALLAAIFGIALLGLLALRTGAAFVMFGYGYSDSCWLRRTGQLIVSSKSIPASDPFSFMPGLQALAGPAQPYVLYQWLAEVIFYLICRSFSLTGLLSIASVIMAAALLSIPFRACIRAGAPVLWSFLAVSALCIVGLLRSFIRPEIFTLFFTALWLLLLQGVRERAAANGTDATEPVHSQSLSWINVLVFPLMMILWCNLHCFFILGLMLLLAYAVAFWLQDLKRKKAPSQETKFLIRAFMLSLAATLINPYGFGLWRYLPHVFQIPLILSIDECWNITTAPANYFIYFVVLAALCYLAILVFLFRQLKSDAEGMSQIRSVLPMFSLAMVIAATIGGAMSIRLMPVAAVTMLIETANLIGGNQNGKAWLDFFSKRKRLFLVVEIAILLVAPLGVNQTARVFPVSIPQPSPYFVPPFAGIRAFAEHYSGGRILATLAIGSMIDLFVNEKSSLYMDTRLDLYSKEAVEQYFTMIQAKKGWKDLLDHYQIDWVFLTPENQLSTELERDTGWTTVFKDKTASLFHRR